MKRAIVERSRDGIVAIGVAASLVLGGGCKRGSQAPPGLGEGSASAGAASADSRAASIRYADKDVVTLRMPVTSSSFHYGAIVVADKYGFYRAKGLKMKYVEVEPGSEAAIGALKKGEVDLLVGHPDVFVDALLAGVKAKALVSNTKGHPNFPHDTAWVPIDSPIKEPRDVIGKRVGGLITPGWAQGCAAFYWSQYFKKNGIAPSQVINALVPPKLQEQSLQQGLIDIMTVDPPLTGIIARTGKYRQLWSSWDITKGDVIDKQDAEISVSGFTQEFIERNPDVVKRYVRATSEALAFTVDNHEVYIDWIQGRAGWSPSVHDHGDYQDWSTGLVRAAALQKWIDWKVELGQLKTGQVGPRELYSNEFNPYSAYAMNDPVKDPTYWDTLPREFLYLPIKK